jgi:hypothetical protein
MRQPIRVVLNASPTPVNNQTRPLWDMHSEGRVTPLTVT